LQGLRQAGMALLSELGEYSARHSQSNRRNLSIGFLFVMQLNSA
jgi:hypothetical protein